MEKEYLKAYLSGSVFAVMPRTMDAFLGVVNSESRVRALAVEQVANNSVTYEAIRNIAVISVEGGTAKKSMSGMCMSIASYDRIVAAIDRAEADSKIDTMVFRVDTPGGDVSGVDEVGDRIFNSKLKTITFYENTGASAGIWWGSASDELHASETTLLGSIGVIAAYTEPSEDPNAPKRVAVVSKNAENKSCGLKGDCKEKLQTMLDSYEAMFHARVERNTGFSSEQIKTTFNSGDVIFAKDALAAGFIKSITTFANLMDNLSGLSYNEGVQPISALRGGKDKNLIQGADMTFDRENLDATEALFNAMAANKVTLENRNAALSVELETATANLEAKEAEISGFGATLEAAKVQAVEEAKAAFLAEAGTRVSEAIACGVEAPVAVAMLEAASAEEASKLALKADETVGGTAQPAAPVDAGAELTKRCEALGIVFIG